MNKLSLCHLFYITASEAVLFYAHFQKGKLLHVFIHQNNKKIYYFSCYSIKGIYWKKNLYKNINTVILIYKKYNAFVWYHIVQLLFAQIAHLATMLNVYTQWKWQSRQMFKESSKTGFKWKWSTWMQKDKLVSVVQILRMYWDFLSLSIVQRLRAEKLQ